MRRLQVIIDAGEKTCARTPGKWCQFLGSSHLGSNPLCLLFRDKHGDYRQLRDEKGGVEGWMQRLPECIATELERRALQSNDSRLAIAAERLRTKDLPWRNRPIEERCAQLDHEYRRDMWDDGHPLKAEWDDLTGNDRDRAIDEFRQRLSSNMEWSHHAIVRDFVLALDKIAELTAELERLRATTT